MATVGASAQAQDAPAPAAGRALSIVPSFSLSETLTDNAGLTATDKQTEFITSISAGIRVNNNGGRIRGFLDYSLGSYLYANGTQKNGFQNALNAMVKAEAIENFAFIDVTGNISQQAISAFGKQTVDPALNDANRTEVTSYSVSPYLRGRFLETGNYEVRLTQSATRSDADGNFNSSTTQGQLHLGGGSPMSTLTWTADLIRQSVGFDAGQRSDLDSLKLALDFSVTPELKVSLLGGREANNIGRDDTESRTTTGLSAQWQPTERTKVFAEVQRRFFGNSHNFSFEHRMPRTVWRYLDTQSISTGNNQPTSSTLGTAYDLYFVQLASVQPDPVLRAQLVNGFLQANGINPNTPLIAGFLSSGLTLQRRQELSFGFNGLRDTLTFTAFRTSTQRLDGGTAVRGDPSSAENIRQTGFYADASHRLTPDATLNLVISQQRSTGSLDSQSTSLQSVSLLWSSRIGRGTHVTAAVRHARFSSSTQPYTENAVTATLRQEF